MVSIAATAVVDGTAYGINVTVSGTTWDRSHVAHEWFRNAARDVLIGSVKDQTGAELDPSTIEISETHYTAFDDDAVCVDSNSDEYPEHAFESYECRRCGAEPEDGPIENE